jgi:hypothetical protein
VDVSRKYGIVLLAQLGGHGWILRNVAEDVLVRQDSLAAHFRGGQGETGREKRGRNCKDHG